MKKINRLLRSFAGRVIRRRTLDKIVHEDFRYLIEGQGKDFKSGHILKRIMLEYHVIEKGLTMPDMRLGFGEKVLLALISDINSYVNAFGENDEQVNVAIQVVLEYKRVHNQAQYQLKEEVLEAIETLKKFENRQEGTTQRLMTKEEFYSHNGCSFAEFASSRHSVRFFDGAIEVEDIKNAIELAQTAPSACNRQSTRVKVVTDKSLIEKVFAIQHGNRGFGHLADKLIVLTVDMQYWDIATYWGGYVDGGIYAMNLLYSLHYNKIAACPLNANLNANESHLVKTLLNIPDTESIFLFIAIGGVPDTFRLTNSHRTEYKSILTII